MDFKRTISTPDKPRDLAAAIRQLLSREGLDVVKSTGEGMIIHRGPASFTNPQHSPFQELTSVKLITQEHEVIVRAEFGGVRAMRLFLLIFIPALTALLEIVTALLPGTQHTPEPQVWGPLEIIPLCGTGVFLLIPLLAGYARYRTRKALESLLRAALRRQGTSARPKPLLHTAGLAQAASGLESMD